MSAHKLKVYKNQSLFLTECKYRMLYYICKCFLRFFKRFFYPPEKFAFQDLLIPRFFTSWVGMAINFPQGCNVVVGIDLGGREALVPQQRLDGINISTLVQ